MLDTLRNSARGTAGKVIVGLIVLTFVLFGAESIISIAGNNAPATVNGENISEVDFQRALATRQQELVGQLGAEFAAQLANSDFLQQEVINSLINQNIQNQLASELKFSVGEEQVLASLASIPAFQIEGQFDQNRYLNVLAANGYDHNSFMEAQRSANAITQFQDGIANSAFIVERAVETVANLNAQKRTIAYKEFSSENFESAVSLSEEDLQDYYAENSSDFLSDEEVKVNYLLVTVDDIAKQMVATDAELEAAYSSYLEAIRRNETREISHILFTDGDDLTAQAEGALARINAGEDFGELAIELSDDPGSAAFGGSLGVLLEGVYDDAFYDAAVALIEAGQVSGLVNTEYGIHLIKLDSISSAQAESFEEKSQELAQDIRQRKARDEMLLVESQLADASFTSDQLSQVAEQFQVDENTSGWISRSNAEGVFGQANVIQNLFSLQVVEDGMISDVNRLENGDLLVFQKSDYRPEDVMSFDDVKADISTTLTQLRANELMLQAIKEAANSTVSTDESWTTVELSSRTNVDVPRTVLTKAFSLPKPTDGSLEVAEVDGEGVAYVVALLDVVEATPNEEENSVAQAFVDQFVSSAQYQIVFNNARDTADIKIRR